MLEKYLKKLHKKAKKIFKIKKKKLKKLTLSDNLSSFRILGQYEKYNNIIYINKKLIEEIGEKKYYPILRHEYGHFLTDLLYGEVEPHGKEWKEIMVILGDKNPSATTNIVSKELKQAYKESFVKVKCKCTEHKISNNKATRIINKTNKYICKLCNSKLRVIENS